MIDKMTPEEFEEIRRNAKLTRKELGAILGVNYLTTWRYSNGISELKKLTVDKMRKIKKAIDPQ